MIILDTKKSINEWLLNGRDIPQLLLITRYTQLKKVDRITPKTIAIKQGTIIK